MILKKFVVIVIGGDDEMVAVTEQSLRESLKQQMRHLINHIFNVRVVLKAERTVLRSLPSPPQIAPAAMAAYMAAVVGLQTDVDALSEQEPTNSAGAAPLGEKNVYP